MVNLKKDFVFDVTGSGTDYGYTGNSALYVNASEFQDDANNNNGASWGANVWRCPVHVTQANYVRLLDPTGSSQVHLWDAASVPYDNMNVWQCAFGTSSDNTIQPHDMKYYIRYPAVPPNVATQLTPTIAVKGDTSLPATSGNKWAPAYRQNTAWASWLNMHIFHDYCGLNLNTTTFTTSNMSAYVAFQAQDSSSVPTSIQLGWYHEFTNLLLGHGINGWTWNIPFVCGYDQYLFPLVAEYVGHSLETIGGATVWVEEFKQSLMRNVLGLNNYNSDFTAPAHDNMGMPSSYTPILDTTWINNIT